MSLLSHLKSFNSARQFINEKVSESLSRRLIICIAGKLGTGKSTLARALTSECLEYFRASSTLHIGDAIREELYFSEEGKKLFEAKGISTMKEAMHKMTVEKDADTRLALQKVAMEKRKVEGNEAWIKRTVFKIISQFSQTSSSVIIIPDLRLPEEFSYLREALGKEYPDQPIDLFLFRIVAPNRAAVALDRESNGDTQVRKRISESVTETAFFESMDLEVAKSLPIINVHND